MISEFASTTDGDRIAITNMNWSTDIKSDKLCIQISKNVKWSHYKCTDKFYYICQQIIALPTIAYTSLIMSNTVSVIYTEERTTNHAYSQEVLAEIMFCALQCLMNKKCNTFYISISNKCSEYKVNANIIFRT